jgi:predicted ATPase
VVLGIEGQVTSHSSVNALDEYRLSFSRGSRGLTRSEEFTFKRSPGRGRRLTVSGRTVKFEEYAFTDPRDIELSGQRQLATSQTTGLAALPRLGESEGGAGIRQFTEFLTGIRVLEPDVVAARTPSRELGAPLADDAGNLADALRRIHRLDPDAWGGLVWDASQCLPGLEGIHFAPVGGSSRPVSVQLVERGLSHPIDLIDASFGTVRLLAMLAALHDPEPAAFIAIEEVDHGLHPYALDLLVDRLRAASRRSQILAATHSPTLLNRLTPEEIVVCDRDPQTGASIVPAVRPDQIRAAMSATDFRAGELWFAGAIRGVPA